MQVSEHSFASTQPIQPLPGPQVEPAAPQQPTTDSLYLQQRLYQAPDGLFALLLRMLHLRMTAVLLMPTVAGAVLAWWDTGLADRVTLLLLLASTSCTLLGIHLLNEYRDYLNARDSNDVKFNRTLYATTYHLLGSEQLQPRQVTLLGHLLFSGGFLGYLRLAQLIGWPVLFFYALSLLLLYTYSAFPIRYSYRGWGLGELGVFLGYGFFMITGAYFITGKTVSWLPVWVSVPFGLMTVLAFFNYNLLHYRRDWLMRKRTLVVALGSLRSFDVGALLTLLVYASLLAIASLAHVPLLTLVTLAALPLALGLSGRLRDEQPAPEDLLRLHLTTLNASIWTGNLFCLALIADKALF